MLTTGQLEQLDLLLQHEIAEMDRRLADPKWCEVGHKSWDWTRSRQTTLLLVRGWVNDLALGVRIGQGAYSAAGRNFHGNGESLPVLGREVFPAARIEIPCDDLADSQLDSVHQIEC